jgi:hypothetical protein
MQSNLRAQAEIQAQRKKVCSLPLPPDDARAPQQAIPPGAYLDEVTLRLKLQQLANSYKQLLE